MTFRDTAYHFARRAAVARCPGDRERYEEAHDFCALLDRLMPYQGLPAGYRQPPGTPHADPAVRRLWAKSEECRALAETAREPCCKSSLLRMAEMYESMAATVLRG
jgi:hypothetical protein